LWVSFIMRHKRICVYHVYLDNGMFEVMETNRVPLLGYHVVDFRRLKHATRVQITRLLPMKSYGCDEVS